MLDEEGEVLQMLNALEAIKETFKERHDKEPAAKSSSKKKQIA